MARPKKHNALSLRQAAAVSASTTPASSAYPSAYPSEDESQQEVQIQSTFPFMALPSELRNKIYSLVFSAIPSVMDLDPSIFSLIRRTRALAMFFVSKQVYREASHNFLSTHTFRLFPTYPGRYFHTKRPLLARLPKHYRSSITSLQLRLGPGWNNPPRGWVVNEALGLSDCVNVRLLKVFVECDPSDAIYSGFRAGDGFYERFSAHLLDKVLDEVPSISVVEFDAYPSVKRSGDMMSGLGEVVAKHGKVVAWGPERGWQSDMGQAWLDNILLHGGSGMRVSKSAAALA